MQALSFHFQHSVHGVGTYAHIDHALRTLGKDLDSFQTHEIPGAHSRRVIIHIRTAAQSMWESHANDLFWRILSKLDLEEG